MSLNNMARENPDEIWKEMHILIGHTICQLIDNEFT